MIEKTSSGVKIDGKTYALGLVVQRVENVISGIMKTAAMDDAQLDELMRRYERFEESAKGVESAPFDTMRLGTLPESAVNELLADYEPHFPSMTNYGDGSWILTKPAFTHHVTNHLHGKTGHTKMTKEQLRQALLEIGAAADKGTLSHILRYSPTPPGLLGDKQIVGLRNDVWVDKPDGPIPASGVDYKGNGAFEPLTVFNATPEYIQNKLNKAPTKATHNRQFVLTDSEEYKRAVAADKKAKLNKR